MINARVLTKFALGAWFAALSGVLTWLSVAYLRLSGTVSLVWVSSGLIVGYLITKPLSHWPAVLIGSAIGNAVARAFDANTIYVDVLINFADLTETVIVAGAIRALIPDPLDARYVNRMAQVAIGSTLLGCLVSSGLVAPFVAGSEGAWATAREWFAAHVLGMVIVGTLTFVACVEGKALVGPPGKRLRFAIGLAFVATVTAAVFLQSRYPLLFCVLVAQLWITFDQGWRGTVIGIVVLTTIAAIFTALHLGPMFAGPMSDPERVFVLQFFVGAVCLSTWPVALGRMQRVHLTTELRRRESAYRLLAGNLRDLIVHLRADCTRLYVSDSARDILGYEPSELLQPHWDWVHPDDATSVRQALERAFAGEEPQEATFRVLHKEGHYVWIEALARRVVTAGEGQLAEIVYSGRDVSARIVAQAAEAEARRRLKAVADQVPAIIAYFDKNCVYQFANAGVGVYLGCDPDTLIGTTTLREAMGEEVYKIIEPRVIAALCGETVTYERLATVHGVQHHYEVTFLPDVADDGSVRGFFALSYDVTERKQGELAWEQQAHRDALTGLANRREFDARLDAAIATRRSAPRPIALALIDVGHFKAINDTHGHGVGDAVLRAVAHRLQTQVHDTDLVARLGGDEFAVVLEHPPNVDDIGRIGERFVAAMRRPIIVGPTAVATTLSIGIAVASRIEASTSLVEIADRALYAAKARGRNTFTLIVGEGTPLESP